MSEDLKKLFISPSENGMPLILDGAAGSLLQQRGIKSSGALWTAMANTDAPDSVLSVHKEYIEAGAQIITTNTFRTNPAAFECSGTGADFSQAAGAGVKLALNARGNADILVAGSNAPAEDCYQKARTLSDISLNKNHDNHIKYLYLSGCDFILNETQSHMDEIEIICTVCSEERIPFIVSLYTDDMLRLLSGESVFEVIEFIERYAPLAIGFNCISFATIKAILMQWIPDYPWGAYINCGSGNIYDPQIKCGISPREYAQNASELLNFKPSFLGACCGSSPEHIAELRKMLAVYYS
jgi:homocysteine S-methyltransferase